MEAKTLKSAKRRPDSSMDRKVESSQTKPALIGAAVLAVLAVAVVGYLSLDQSTAFTLDGQRLRIETVTNGTYEDFIPLRAAVEPERTVYLDAIEGGRVDQVLVEEGAMVEAGDPLIELSNTQLQLDVIAREAQVSEQLNNLRNTQLAIEQNRLQLKSDLIEIDYQIVRLGRLVERYEALDSKSLISKNEYDQAADELVYWKQRREVTKESQRQDEVIRLAQIDQLNDSVEQLEKNLELARANLDNLLIRAPRAGRLTSLSAELGESKARGERLGQIDDVDRFKAVAFVNEFYLNRVRVGQRASLSVANTDYTLEISKIYPEVSGAQFEVDLRFLGDAPTNVRRGQTLQLRLALGDSTEQAVLLPNGSFYNDTGGAWVFVLESDQQAARRRNVTLGRRNTTVIEVLDGLEPGERVVVSSYASFQDVERLLIEQN